MDNFDIDARYVEFGTEYGRWPTCTEVIRGPLVIYGVGVGTDISWDLEMISGFDAIVYAYDPTPVSKSWIAKQVTLPDRFCFKPIGLAAKSGTITMSAPATKGFASFHINSGPIDTSETETIQVPVETLEELMKANGHSHVDILKMDIEGSEYSVLEALKQGRVRPTQILIEFHHNMHGFTWRDTNRAHKILHQMGYKRFFRSKGGGREQGFILTSELERCRTETRGVVYFAFGRTALREANLSVQSLRESNPGLKSAIFTDLPSDAQHDIIYGFNAQELRDIEYHFKQTNRMPSLKVRFLMQSPFDRTVVLDADTYVKGDISEMFASLDDYDIALTNMPEIEQGVEENKDRPVHKSLKSLTRKGAFSCAVFAFRKSSAMRAVAFEWWSQFVEKTAGEMRMTGNWGATGGGINEQSILHQMIRDGTFSRCGAKRTTLPNIKFNAGMTMWPRLRKEGLWDECAVLHSHAVYQNLNEVGIEGLPELPNLQKFL